MGRQESFPLGSVADGRSLRKKSASDESAFGSEQGWSTPRLGEQRMNEAGKRCGDAALFGDPTQIQSLQRMFAGGLPKPDGQRIDH